MVKTEVSLAQRIFAPLSHTVGEGWGFGEAIINLSCRRLTVTRLITLLVSVLFTLGAPSALAALQAFVDRNPVAADESFYLTLKSNGNLDGSPDLGVLKSDFDVLGQSRGSSIQIINGTTTQSMQWQIRLVPKHSGQLTIPAVKVGGETSQPFILNVTEADQAQAAQQSGELFLEMDASPHTVYVQQQMLLSVRLYRTVNITNGSTLSEPKFPNMDAVVERLGEDRAFQTTRNGQLYAVIERRYAVYPQKSGQFISAPVQFDGEIVENKRSGGIFMFDPFGQNTRHKRVSSKPIALTIKPAHAAATQWLPASKLRLTEQWSETPPRFTVGEPITRTLTLTASGVTSAQLPVLDSAIDGLKLYPDQPALKDNKDDKGISGTRIQKIAIIPTRSGNFTLPAIEVKWWNVNTDKEEVARLPAHSISVLPGSLSLSSTQTASIASGELPAPTDASEGSPLISGMTTISSSSGYWPWLALFFAAGWLATLAAWGWQARTKPLTGREQAPSVASLSLVEKQLQNSCLINNASQVKSHLFVWATLRWPQNPPTSLTGIASLCPPALADALIDLDRVLYAKNKGDWRGEHLWQLFSQFKPEPVTTKAETSTALEPLYKT